MTSGNPSVNTTAVNESKGWWPSMPTYESNGFANTAAWIKLGLRIYRNIVIPHGLTSGSLVTSHVASNKSEISRPFATPMSDRWENIYIYIYIDRCRRSHPQDQSNAHIRASCPHDQIQCKFYPWRRNWQANRRPTHMQRQTNGRGPIQATRTAHARVEVNCIIKTRPSKADPYRAWLFHPRCGGHTAGFTQQPQMQSTRWDDQQI